MVGDVEVIDLAYCLRESGMRVNGSIVQRCEVSSALGIEVRVLCGRASCESRCSYEGRTVRKATTTTSKGKTPPTSGQPPTIFLSPMHALPWPPHRLNFCIASLPSLFVSRFCTQHFFTIAFNNTASVWRTTTMIMLAAFSKPSIMMKSINAKGRQFLQGRVKSRR